MRGWLYLIRNRDLYKIGITKNFKNRMRQLKPDNVIAKLYSSDFKKLERELHNRYKKFRIPQTEYFRLEDHHLKEIKKRLYELDYPISILLGIITKSFLILSLIFILILIVLSLYINDINLIIYNSFFCMERISIGFSLLSLFVHSGKFLNFLTELKYRFSKLSIYIIFSLLFRIASILLH